MKCLHISSWLVLFFFSCSNINTEKNIKYTYKYYKYLDVPSFKLRTELNDSTTNINYVKGIYTDNKLCRLELHYEGDVIKDTVVYQNESVFYIEHYEPKYTNDIMNSYTVRRFVNNTLITYWLIENKEENLKLHAIDSISKIWHYNRYYVEDYLSENIMDFIKKLDNDVPIISNHRTDKFNIFIKDDTANILMQGISSDEYGVNGPIGDTLKSRYNADSTFFQFVQLQYFYPYIIDPFLWGHWK